MKSSRDCSPEYMNDRRDCDCAALAMSYVPWHGWEDIFEPQEALRRATAFPSLEMRFEHDGGNCRKKGAC